MTDIPSPQPGATGVVTDAMVDRFLGWRLPDDFSPDGGVTFKPLQYGTVTTWPSGTNLLNAIQARAMLEFVHANPPQAMTREWCADFPGSAAGIINRLAQRVDELEAAAKPSPAEAQGSALLPLIERLEDAASAALTQACNSGKVAHKAGIYMPAIETGAELARAIIALRDFAASQAQPKGMPAEWLDAFEEWRQTLGAADLDGKRDLVWRHIAGTGFQAGAAWARSQAPAPAPEPVAVVESATGGPKGLPLLLWMVDLPCLDAKVKAGDKLYTQAPAVTHGKEQP